MNREVVEVVMLIDASGSMHGKEHVVEAGYRHFLDEQLMSVRGAANLTVYTFSDADEIEEKYSGNLFESPAKLDYGSTFGQTAIMDALGESITNLEERLSRTLGHAEDSRVIVVLITDGEENASEKWNSSDIEELVKKKQRHQWKFVFIGPEAGQPWSGPPANRDHFNENVMDEVIELDEADAYDIQKAFEKTSQLVSNYREKEK